VTCEETWWEYIQLVVNVYVLSMEAKWWMTLLVCFTVVHLQKEVYSSISRDLLMLTDVAVTTLTVNATVQLLHAFLI